MLKRYLLAGLAALAMAAMPAFATTVLPQKLDGIVHDAAIAFEGTCLSNRTERDPQTNLVVTYTTFSVSDVVKGTVGSTYTIKQVGGELPDGLTYRVIGVPKFTVGEQYVVFLYGKSRSGFSSPVGLSQGRFVVRQGAAGPEVSNGRDLREMTADIPETELPQDIAPKLKGGAEPLHGMDLGDFKRLVRSRMREVVR